MSRIETVSFPHNSDAALGSTKVMEYWTGSKINKPQGQANVNVHLRALPLEISLPHILFFSIEV